MSDKMNRREFINVMGTGTAAIVLPNYITQRTEKERPNILWISAEDLSPDLGCYGYDLVRTPNIDRLASEGIRYTNAFTVAGVCAPSRSAIITGMYPSTIGSMHMRTWMEPKYVGIYSPPGINYECVPPPYVKCFTEYLRASGYYCTNRAKTDYQFKSPVTAWDRDQNNYGDWEGRENGQPFFCVINHMITHESKMRIPLEKDPIIDPESIELPPYYPDSPAFRRDWARNLDNIETLDKQVGELLDRLEKDGLAENTAVFFWGDHGRGLARAKQWIYDAGIHVPLIIRWPGAIKPGTVCDDLISFIDLGPTVLSIAGVNVPSYMQGQALLGAQKAPPRDYIFAISDRMDETYDTIRAVRDKNYKYIRNYWLSVPYSKHITYSDMMPSMQEWRKLDKEGKLKGPSKLFFEPRKPEELYDIRVDPHEINNLANDPEHQDVLQKMRKVLEDWMKETKDLGLVPEEVLIEMMWPGKVQPKTDLPEIRPGSGTYSSSVKLKITCSTEGASIAYTTESGDNPHWLLYTGELTLDKNVELRIKAIRYGYAESPEVKAKYIIMS
ncbi:MAG TPA: sulfatase-like hydrolase/transferase [archaeon]|nr:sulfatase-like hydrolase/transferase [archaeon]